MELFHKPLFIEASYTHIYTHIYISVFLLLTLVAFGISLVKISFDNNYHTYMCIQDDTFYEKDTLMIVCNLWHETSVQLPRRKQKMKLRQKWHQNYWDFCEDKYV